MLICPHFACGELATVRVVQWTGYRWVWWHHAALVEAECEKRGLRCEVVGL